MVNKFTFSTAGGRITCFQCQAMSKRTEQQCRAPATKGQNVCRFHGGRSTGPKTLDGRQRIVDAMTTHGNEARAVRIARSERLSELEALDTLGRLIGLIKGPKKRGRKCKAAVEFTGLNLMAQRIAPQSR